MGQAAPRRRPSRRWRRPTRSCARRPRRRPRSATVRRRSCGRRRMPCGRLRPVKGLAGPSSPPNSDNFHTQMPNELLEKCIVPAFRLAQSRNLKHSPTIHSPAFPSAARVGAGTPLFGPPECLAYRPLPGRSANTTKRLRRGWRAAQRAAILPWRRSVPAPLPPSCNGALSLVHP